MSIEPDKISCTQCDYETVEVHLPIIVSYVLADGSELESGREKGWCYDCDEYSDIENVDLARLQRELSALHQKNEELVSRLERLSNGLLARLRNAPERESLRLEIEWLERDRRRLSGLLELSKQRESPPRCLRCWSSHTVPVSFDNNGISNDFVHKCGGRLRIVPDSMGDRFSFELTRYVLDIEGRLLEERHE